MFGELWLNLLALRIALDRPEYSMMSLPPPVLLAASINPEVRQERPSVTLSDTDTWNVVSGPYSRHYVANYRHPPQAIIDEKRRRIVVPASQYIVGLDFQCHALWKYNIYTAFDPRPLLEVDGIVIAGVNRIGAKRYPGTWQWPEIVHSDRTATGVVGIDINTGRVRWKKNLSKGGSPLCRLNRSTFISLRITNEKRFLKNGEPARYQFDEWNAPSGSLVHVWNVIRPPRLLLEALSWPPGESVEGHVLCSLGPKGWELTIGIPKTAAQIKLIFPPKGGSARCMVCEKGSD